MNSSKYFDYIEEKLNYSALRLESRAKLTLFDLHIKAEDFYKQFFNILYDLNLINANELEQNSEGIDLIDKNKKIIISVSSTATKSKIMSGMTKKSISKYNGYNFQFISISKPAKKLRQLTYRSNPHNLQFDPMKDIFDKDKLLRQVLHMDRARLLKLYELFRVEYSTNIEEFEKSSYTEAFNKFDYAKKALLNYFKSDFKYTMLIAKQKEMDTFVDLRNENNEERNIKVLNIISNSNNNISYLLGESGAGKSTSLWRIFTTQCKLLSEGESEGIKPPVFIVVRRWTSSMDFFQLFKDALNYNYDENNLITELRSGSFVILIDGINEIEINLSRDCYEDIANFIAIYPNNKYVVACRSTDYRKNIIPIINYNPVIPEPNVYEISRLSKEQLINYSVNYFETYSIDADDFLSRIGAYNDFAWNKVGSSLQLARIPLFLQIFLETFRKTGNLPDSKAKLLKSLVAIFFEREITQNIRFFDEYTLKCTLSKFSYELQKEGYTLRLPTSLAKTKMLNIFSELKLKGVVNSELSYGNFWDAIFSANYLKYHSDTVIEWLHQLIRDYFLGVEIAKIWIESSDDKNLLKRMAHSSQWDMAFIIALDILSESHHGAELLWMMIELDTYNAVDTYANRVFEGQSSEARYNIATSFIKCVIDDGDFETNKLTKLSINLPFYEVVEALSNCFYYTKSEVMIGRLMESMSNMIIEHLPKLNSQTTFGYYSIYKDREHEKTKAVDRCQELLLKHLNGSNELASFYAAKGLWEFDRSLCVERLSILIESKSENVRKLALDLAEEWGIY